MRNAPRFSAAFVSDYMYTDSIDRKGCIYMIKKWIYFLFTVALIAKIVIPTSAAQGSVRVNTEAAGAVLYRVGAADGNGYRLKEEFGGGYLTFDDTLSQALADWLYECASDEEKIPSDKDGRVFSNLEEGLYLVCSEDAQCFPPFLVIIPWDGYHWNVEVDPLDYTSPETGDSVGTAILIMAASGAGISALCKRKKFY